MPNSTDLDRLAANGQIVTKYVDPDTEEGEGFQDELLPFPISPNGSARNIAGICDSTGLVFGLMPHPERACDETIGGTDGLFTLKSLILK